MLLLFLIRANLPVPAFVPLLITPEMILPVLVPDRVKPLSTLVELVKFPIVPAIVMFTPIGLIPDAPPPTPEVRPMLVNETRGVPEVILLPVEAVVKLIVEFTPANSAPRL